MSCKAGAVKSFSGPFGEDGAPAFVERIVRVLMYV